MMTFAWIQPVLPPTPVLPWVIAASWGWLCAALLCWAARAWNWRSLRLVAMAVGASALLPWTQTWTAHLALAFQTPSMVTLLACTWMAWGSRWKWLNASQPDHSVALGLWPWAGLVLGWALWVDAFNRWPASLDVPLYAWGFGAPALWVVLTSVWASAAWSWHRARVISVAHAVVAAALLLFVWTRIPTGNVWDALLDPWLWLWCHWLVLRGAWVAWRTNKYSRQNSNVSGV